MKKLKTSWAIFRRSLGLIRRNKKLLIFPIVTSACTVGIVLFFFAPVVLQPTGHAYTESAHWKAVCNSVLSEDLQLEFSGAKDEAAETEDSGVHDAELSFFLSKPALLMLVPLYFLSVFLAAFFNLAFYSEIINALNGRPVSVGGGLHFAMSRLGQVLRWSMLAATVGCILKALEEQLDFVGDRIVRALGLTWSIACVFVLPVIVREGKEKNPVTYLKRSAGVIRKTWGEALVGFVGLRGVPILFVAAFGVLWVVSLAITFYALETGPILAIVMGGGFLLWILLSLAFGYLCGVMEKIYIAALYVYASEGVVPEGFDAEALDSAWEVK